jgi:hypothetical protein
MMSIPECDGPAVWLHVASPLFTGETPDPTVMLKRKAGWYDFKENGPAEELNRFCGKGSGRGGTANIACYSPGKEIQIRHRPNQDPVRVIFPPDREVAVPKGFVARLHLLLLQESIDKDLNPADVIFGFIDGSGAFKYDNSLKLLVEPFKEDPTVDVVLGKRPDNDSGMPPGRKEMEEFEQYLLFRHRPTQIRRSFSDYDLHRRLLPDGQAGCWAFRLTAAQHLPLTASGYEIEFDLLASAIDAGLKCAYTRPLLMSDEPRHSSASADPFGTSLKKLPFIERKLGISRSDVAEAWNEFAAHFAESPLVGTLRPGYENALMKYCRNEE